MVLKPVVKSDYKRKLFMNLDCDGRRRFNSFIRRNRNPKLKEIEKEERKIFKVE